MKASLFLLIFGLMVQSTAMARPAIYFDENEDDGFYLTDGKTKIKPSAFGVYKEADSLFHRPEALEQYHEYLNNCSKAGTSFLLTIVGTTGVGILLNNVGINNSGAFIAADVIIGYFTLIFLPSHYLRKAGIALNRAENIENGVYDQRSTFKEPDSEQASLGLSPKVYGLSLSF